MTSTGFTLDSRAFSRRIERLRKEAFPGQLELGLTRAGMQCMNDCVQKAPSVPMDEGTLQASGSVFVESHLTGTSEGLSPASHGTPARDHRESSGRHETVAVIGFNQPQAARLHEHPEYNFQRKKGTEGGKFLETKLVVYRRDYLEIVADTLREMK